MKSVRHKLCGALLLAFALTAIASASASAALPEFVPSEGAKFPMTFERHGNGETFGKIQSTGSGSQIDCKGVASKVEITGAKAGSLVLEFENCQFGSTGKKCSNEGAPTGHIVVSGSASLVYIKKAANNVGVVVKFPEFTFKCEGGLKYKVKRGIIIPISPINTSTSEIFLSVLEKGSGKQEFTQYENELGELKSEIVEMNFGVGFLQGSFDIGERYGIKSSKSLTIKA